MPRPTGPVLSDPRWAGMLPGHYGKRQQDAEQAYQNALQGLAYKQGGLFQRYGVKGNIGEGGATTFDIDPTAGHGVFQDMFRSQADSLINTQDATRMRGFKGRGGLGSRKEGLLRFMQGGERANMLTELLNSAQGIYGERQGALGIRNSEFTGAETDAFNYLEQGGFFKDPEAPAAQPPGGGGAAAPRPPWDAPGEEGGYQPGPYSPYSMRKAPQSARQLFQTARRRLY